MFELTEDQKQAIDKISVWFRSEIKNRIYTVSGAAGTGKTTMIKYLVESLGIKDKTAFITYTGKASIILRRKLDNQVQTSTIHRLIYNVRKDKDEKVRFELKMKEELKSVYKLLIVDESSMVSTDIFQHLLSFEIPLLLIGDSAQLPPIFETESIFKNANFHLKELTRFSAENPIVQLSQKIIRGEKIHYGKYSDDVLVVRDIPANRDSVLLSADQVLCSMNTKRNYLNSYIRNLKGIKDSLPVLGDKIVCRKNSWDNLLPKSNTFLVNGLVGTIDSEPNQEEFTYYDKILRRSRFDTIFRFDFKPLQEEEFFESIKWDYDTLMDGHNDCSKKPGMYDTGVNICNYAYAITVHTAQGSEYEKGIFYADQLFGENEMRNKLLYTGITRFSKKLILVL